MAHRGKNKGQRTRPRDQEEPWFKARKRKAKERRKAERDARRKQRRK